MHHGQVSKTIAKGLKELRRRIDRGKIPPSKLDETLTLHRLGLFKELGRSFKTTNCIENLNSLVAQRTGKVDYWKNADQKHRWLATALLDIEPRLNKVSGCKQLARLRTALQTNLKGCREQVA